MEFIKNHRVVCLCSEGFLARPVFWCEPEKEHYNKKQQQQQQQPQQQQNILTDKAPISTTSWELVGHSPN